MQSFCWDEAWNGPGPPPYRAKYSTLLLPQQACILYILQSNILHSFPAAGRMRESLFHNWSRRRAGLDIPIQRTAPARETMPRLSPSAWGVFPVGSAPRRATKAQTGQQQKRAERRGVRPAWQRIYFGSEKHRFRGAWGRSCACAAIPPALPLVKFRNIQTVPGLLERSALPKRQWGWRVGIPLWAGRRSGPGNRPPRKEKAA